jgi:hypothetical protein
LPHARLLRKWLCLSHGKKGADAPGAADPDAARQQSLTVSVTGICLSPKKMRETKQSHQPFGRWVVYGPLFHRRFPHPQSYITLAIIIVIIIIITITTIIIIIIIILNIIVIIVYHHQRHHLDNHQSVISSHQSRSFIQLQ